jgi:predicted permease
LLARAAARQRELSVRMAVGASRWRVIRQLMTESLLLAALGAAAGFLLAVWGSRLLVQLLSTPGRRIEIDLSPDLHLLAFTMAVTILTAILFGLAPALRATRIGVNHVLKEHARGAVRGSTRVNLGKTLMAGQVALSLILLVGAGLFLQTLRNLLSIDPGFSRHNVLLVTADVQQVTVPKAQRTRIYAGILDRLRALPGVASAASSTLAPMGQQGWNWVVQPEGYSAKSPQDALVYLNRVSPRYFQTIRTPLLIGRDFSERDDLNAPKVMVISESASRQFFGSANPIGKTIGNTDPLTGGTRKGEIYEVIGVVKDVKYNRIDEKPRRTAYLASGQEEDNPWPTIRFEIRSDGPVEALIPSIRSAIAGVNRDLLLEFRNFETQVNESLLQPRIVALLSSIFGSLALGLAIVGLYGITTYHVAQRKAEVGIRMALGAQRRSVIWLILRDMALLLAIGMGLGLGASLAAGRLIISLLYDVRPNDPVQLAAAAFTLAAATAIAAYLPARRAARLDPMVALREE